MTFMNVELSPMRSGIPFLCVVYSSLHPVGAKAYNAKTTCNTWLIYIVDQYNVKCQNKHALNNIYNHSEISDWLTHLLDDTMGRRKRIEFSVMVLFHHSS